MYELDYIEDKIQYYYDTLKSKYGFDVAYIALYGSQNYGLDIYTDEYMSDVDAKAVIIPSLKSLIAGEKISTTVEFDSGLCDVKDIRIYLDNIFKANINYLETMFSDFKIINSDCIEDFERFLMMGEEIVSLRISTLFKTACGMAQAKFDNLTKTRPSSLEDIMRFGYSPKELHHIVRIYFLLFKYYFEHKSFRESLCPIDKKDFLIDIKLGKYSKEEALKMGGEYLNEIKSITDYVISRNPFDCSVRSKLDGVVYDIIKNRIEYKIKRE